MYSSEYGYLQNFIDYIMQIFYMILDLLKGLDNADDETEESTTGAAV